MLGRHTALPSDRDSIEFNSQVVFINQSSCLETVRERVGFCAVSRPGFTWYCGKLQTFILS